VTLPDAVAAVLWVGVTAYALFGGAFGAGFWAWWPAVLTREGSSAR